MSDFQNYGDPDDDWDRDDAEEEETDPWEDDSDEVVSARYSDPSMYED